MQKTTLRLPQDLHQQIIEAARHSGSSMNAEIIARLRVTFDGLSENFKFEFS
ncbi:MAG: Arc family DNA-binding protein [Thiofilum sp.]|nr:Arc family DNA-binding protein [Thiofilum sp.]